MGCTGEQWCDLLFTPKKECQLKEPPLTEVTGLSFRRSFGIIRVGHFISRALTIWVSNPQNALARISFHSPKSLPPLSKPCPCRYHAVATAGQLAISPKTSWSCSPHTPLIHGQLSGFFLSFPLQRLLELQKYTSTFWQGIGLLQQLVT